ncbi:glycerol-3-phosphate dehydrogenase/oxidase [Sphingobacterium sp. lm-10]|uniref:glycerol-3-phosphate dehydrogenase/oxidase n=1 Tax=Sphingobacterium sp. lm-10 TaxID=2944904 RepID=UPI002021B741|nr:glycerol-3-phosphate dehydrogenase/oxidase [Sphingobacterium sp. lm-10]MCL7989175.1 glycerol-3-phosphate dehydrogenase/oxidase [Sphingobacterium sp. lm-10]
MTYDARFLRETQYNRLTETTEWDFIVIGGGATGLGVAVDAASRGFKTLLLEKTDFAKGTSSRSTKLVHGGVRYLAQGDIKLVYGALRERWRIFKNAPHVSRTQSFIIPCYSFIEKWKYLIGLKLYDWLAGKYSIGRSVFLSKKDAAQHLGNLKTHKLQGGVRYYDGQFDDARLAVNLAQTAMEHQACVLNHTSVTAVLKNTQGQVDGVAFVDLETDRAYQVRGRAIINATGIFVDDILSMASPKHARLVRPSQGTHVVIDRSFLPEAQDALMIPKTSDGRVLFGVPWHDYLVLGTTDTAVEEKLEEPIPLEEEIDFILSTAASYLDKAPTRADVLSTFSGLRPLAANLGKNQKTKEISRDHKLIVHDSKLITITGGKWTTYRKMAEDTVNKGIETSGLSWTECKTASLPIHGSETSITPQQERLAFYGSDAAKILALEKENPPFAERILPELPHTVAQVVWAIHVEMARTVEDVLARRLRILFLDAKLAVAAAPVVAHILATELEYDIDWEAQQVRAFEALAKGYFTSGAQKQISLSDVSH